MVKIVLVVLLALASAHEGCYKHHYGNVQEHVFHGFPMLPIDQLPTSLDWSNYNNTDFMTIAKNQHIPQY